MKPRFQADADLNQRIVAGVVRLEPAMDFQTAMQAELEGRSDTEVLRLCADAGRILVTHDQRTMPQHFAQLIAERNSPGVLIVPQDLPVGAAVQDLYLAWAASEAEEWTNAIRRLPLGASRHCPRTPAAPERGRPARFARTASATARLNHSLPPTRKAARRAALRGSVKLRPVPL